MSEYFKRTKEIQSEFVRLRGYIEENNIDIFYLDFTSRCSRKHESRRSSSSRAVNDRGFGSPKCPLMWKELDVEEER